MTWNILFEDKSRLVFKESHTAKYNLRIKTDTVIGGVVLKSEAEITWLIQININPKGDFKLNLITLDHRLISYSNPMLREIADISQTFGRLYNDLELLMSEEGKIEKILNYDTIVKKWEYLKKDLDKLSMEANLTEIIKLNESTLENEQKVIANIMQTEFFAVFFNLYYSEYIPNTTSEYKTYNLLNTHLVKWRYHLSLNELKDKTKIVKQEGKLAESLDKKWFNKAYENFMHIDLENKKAILKDEAQYHLGDKNQVLLGKIIKSEIVDTNFLYAKYEYDLEMVEDSYQTLGNVLPNSTLEQQKQPPRSSNSLIID